MTTGQKIKWIRTYRGMSMQKLGIALGLNACSASVRVSQWETGTRHPRPEIIQKIAHVLNVSPERLQATQDDQINALIEHILSQPLDGVGMYEELSRLNAFLAQYFAQLEKVKRGLIAPNDFIEWKLHWTSKGGDAP